MEPNRNRQRRRGFHFVQVQSPDDDSWRRQVRSYAARNDQRRQQRVREYQEQQMSLSGYRDTQSHPLTLMSAATTDPFGVMSQRLNPMEWYLFNHHASMSDDIATFCTPNTAEVQRSEAAHSYVHESWLRMAVEDSGFLSALLLGACRHLIVNHPSPEKYDMLALQYSSYCMRNLRNALQRQDTMISDATMTLVLALACDALLTGQIEAADFHIQGFERMVERRGSTLDNLGHGLFVSIMVIRCKMAIICMQRE
ncbi:hypothetical protein B0I35DRAFT_516224 [Stachybotrys elegans]|uniref:Transcription factor domain-containing protein n=1 Tax=Stachybotrys elegans TaxID=80388 RepID=A0A8K0SJV7_9HYPO|nr:hypothetical protein B0I35DRAFT_516224 [Stachybotrys elegans]